MNTLVGMKENGSKFLALVLEPGKFHGASIWELRENSDQEASANYPIAIA